MKPAKRVITSRHCQLDLRTFLKSEFKFNPLFWGTTKNLTSIANLNTTVCYLQPGFLTISLRRKKTLDPLWLAASAKETSWSREDPGVYHRAPWLNVLVQMVCSGSSVRSVRWQRMAHPRSAGTDIQLCHFDPKKAFPFHKKVCAGPVCDFSEIIRAF